MVAHAGSTVAAPTGGATRRWSFGAIAAGKPLGPAPRPPVVRQTGCGVDSARGTARSARYTTLVRNSLGPGEPGARTRSLPLRHAAPAAVEQRLQPLLRAGHDGPPPPARPTVLAACHANEKATECRRPPLIGKSHGRLTATLLDMPQAILRERGAELISALCFSMVYRANQVPLD